MDFELTEDFIKESALTEEQVAKISTRVKDYSAELKQSYDGTASTNAEKILDGAAASIEKTTGVAREQGEKIADYITRAHDAKLNGLQTELEKSKNEYLEKLANNPSGGEKFQKELDDLKEKYDAAQQKLANFDELNEKATNYETLSTEHKELKDNLAFSSVKPSFSEDVNEFEAAHKWGEFMSGIKNAYDIEYVDGKPIAISKENKHKQYPLSELVEKDEVVMALKSGRQQRGNGANVIDKIKIEGVPFEVPKDAPKSTIAGLIRDHIVKEEKISITDSRYSARFAELHKTIKNQGTGE